MEKNNEVVLYEGGPSQMVNYNNFTICALIFICAICAPKLWDNLFVHYFTNKDLYINVSKTLFFISIFSALFCWLKISTHKYTITTERFIETRGVLSRTTNELELFRVRDISLYEPFSLRVIGCGNIIMDTTDKSTPIVALSSIKNPRPVMEILRRNVALTRKTRGVREIGM